MINPREIEVRRVDRARAAGERWQRMASRRTATVRSLRQGGPAAADLPERVERYHARESLKRATLRRAGLSTSALMERRIGPTLDLDDDPPTDAARVAGMPVGRIVVLSDEGRVLDGFATGFLLAPGLVMTNHHVFASAGECEGCGIEFGFERVGGALQQGVTFRYDPARFFLSDETLDFAIVAVEAVSASGRRLEDYRTLPLDPMTGKILVGQPISIIQHPDGGPKKFGVRDNELLIAPSEDDLFLQYSTDTLPGSSGAPAFNKDWEVVALHHSGVPEMKDGQIMTIRGEPWRRGMRDEEIHWVANEGARVSCIYQSLRGRTVPREHHAMLALLLESFGEDFSKLPALQSERENMAMDPLGPQLSRTGVSITIHGPGNFYFPAAAPREDASRGTDGLRAQPSPAVPTAVEKKIVFDPDYDSRPGYLEGFLGIDVPPPGVTPARRDELLMEDRAPVVLTYHHYSLVMHRRRRTPMWTAMNADYTRKYRRRKERKEFGSDTWVPDPRILPKHQIMDQELYAPAAKFDRGHVVRRDDTAWGVTAKEEAFANSDSFHWTNCTPQHEAFNRDVAQYAGIGVWGMLENHITKQARNVGNRLTIFAGPVLSDDDIVHDFGGGSVMIPVRFWKVVVALEDHDSPQRRLAAFGFLLDQSYAIEDYGIERTERFDPGEFQAFQTSLDEITELSGVTFDETLHAADPLGNVGGESRRVRLASAGDVRITAR